MKRPGSPAATTSVRATEGGAHNAHQSPLKPASPLLHQDASGCIAHGLTSSGICILVETQGALLWSLPQQDDRQRMKRGHVKGPVPTHPQISITWEQVRHAASQAPAHPLNQSLCLNKVTHALHEHGRSSGLRHILKCPNLALEGSA